MKDGRHSNLLRLAGALLVLVVVGAAHLPSSSAPGDAATSASFGEWVATTFPTAEAGFARQAPGAAR